MELVVVGEGSVGEARDSGVCIAMMRRVDKWLRVGLVVFMVAMAA